MKKYFDYTLFEFDNYELKVSSVLLLIILIIGVNLVLRIIRKSIYATSHIDVVKKYSYYSLLKYLVYVFAIVFGFRIIGFNLTLLLTGAAALLVGIGLGLQNIFSDFMSGILILVESRIKIDDILDVNGLVCRVQEINLRTTTVLTRDDKYIILPNTDLTKNQIINWTMNAIASRFEVTVGVSYDSDIVEVNKILKDIIDNQNGALKTPIPFIRFTDFADSALMFSIYFWVEDVYGVENIKSDIRTKIFQAFKEHKIVIPFPQRVMHVSKES